jgi:aromatic ring-opening dioxygenase LigB subunit
MSEKKSPCCQYGYLFLVWELVGLLLLLISMVDAVLVGTILLPHGDFAYDPTLFPVSTRERRISKELALASRQAGRWLLEQAKPDVIFLSTPHGIKLDTDFGIYMSPKGSGYATIGNDLYNNKTSRLYNVSLNVELAPELSQELLELLQRNDPEYNNVSGIYSYDDGSSMPLNWGEIIPLLLLPNISSSTTRRRHLIWSYPHRRYDHSPEMVPELLNLGAQIAQWAHERPERIGVIVSGDLSHTHQGRGPYGYSNASVPFDAAIGQWAATSTACCSPESSTALLEQAKRLQPRALSCGFTGYVLWQGMMCASSFSSNIAQKYESQVFANHNVTYYGMMAAIFAPTTANSQPKQ